MRKWIIRIHQIQNITEKKIGEIVSLINDFPSLRFSISRLSIALSVLYFIILFIYVCYDVRFLCNADYDR